MTSKALEVAPEVARERRLAAHRKYNLSSKGQKRNVRYEAAHPERKLRWEPARNALRSRAGGVAQNQDPRGGAI